MVSANTTQGDGIERLVQYASWRTDKPASEGYSQELISNRVDPKYYDDLGAQPQVGTEDTLLKYFKRNVQRHGDSKFLGTRAKLADFNGKPAFGEYEWKTFNEVDRITESFSKGLVNMNLCPEIEGEGKQWKFLGIWLKNRWEWSASLIACMHYSITAVGFYDAMSVEQVDFILNQTELQTLVVSPDYADKIVKMK